jgi:hypothetical protein
MRKNKIHMMSCNEYGATIYAVVCVAFSVLVNKCVRPSCSLGSTYPKKKTGTHHIKYHICSMRLKTPFFFFKYQDTDS